MGDSNPHVSFTPLEDANALARTISSAEPHADADEPRTLLLPGSKSMRPDPGRTLGQDQTVRVAAVQPPPGQLLAGPLQSIHIQRVQPQLAQNQIAQNQVAPQVAPQIAPQVAPQVAPQIAPQPLPIQPQLAQPQLAQPQIAPPQIAPPQIAQPAVPQPQAPPAPAQLQPAPPQPIPSSNPPPSPSDPERLGQNKQLPRIGRYALLRELGEGGMGVVYAAYDEELDRRVALKLIHPSRQGDSQLRARILREARALARVSSPNVVQVYQVGEVDGQLFIAMEFVNGTTLTKWQVEPGRTWQDILRMYIASGHGLLAAHQAELVHRDFKPDNVLIGKDGRPRVADFGLARIEGMSGPGVGVVSRQMAALNAPTRPISPSLTQAGVVMGTPLYMSPEQHMGDPTDARSDQFSFCVALYEALYQQLPFAGTTLEALAFNTVTGKVLKRPSGSQVPISVHDALLRGLSVAPEHRFPSMRELLTALTYDPTISREAGPTSRRRVTVSMIVLTIITSLGIKLLSALGVGAYYASVITAVATFLVFLFLAVLFRRQMRNLFHRGTWVYGLVFSAHVLMLRGLGLVMGFTYPQIVVLDNLALFSVSSMMVALIMPSLWPLIPLNLGSALASALWPQHAPNIASASIAVSVIVATLQWNRAVATRRHRKSRKEKSQSPSQSQEIVP